MVLKDKTNNLKALKVRLFHQNIKLAEVLKLAQDNDAFGNDLVLDKLGSVIKTLHEIIDGL